MSFTSIQYMSNLITVIDYPCDLDGWVQEVSPDLYEGSLSQTEKDLHRYRVNRDKHVPSVTIICNTGNGQIQGYRYESDINVWSQSNYLGHSNYILKGQYVPEDCSSTDDIFPVERTFKSEPEVLSYLGTSYSSDDEHWYEICPPQCSLEWTWSPFEMFDESSLRTYSKYVHQDKIWDFIMYFQYMVRSMFYSQDEWDDTPRCYHLSWWFQGFRIPYFGYYSNETVESRFDYLVTRNYG